MCSSLFKSLNTLLLTLTIIHCQMLVLGPPKFIERMNELEGEPKIKYTLGNFGEVPYGKTLVGYVLYHKANDGSNYWCDYENTSIPPDVDGTEAREYTPIILVDHSTHCSYTKKALNVKSRRGRVMLLVSDDNTFKPDYNIDDQLGNKVDIPTVIVQKRVGDLFKEYLNSIAKERIILSIKLTGVKEDGLLEIDLFFRSDDIKALHFFKEFDVYYKKLKSRLKFTPIYKYTKYSFADTSDSISAVGDNAPCVKAEKYCSSDNPNLDIDNPRSALLENIRQSCIYSTLHADLNIYWNYMMTFSDTCADIENFSFNEECSKDVMKTLGINIDHIEKCMKKEIESYGKVETDYSLYEEKGVRKVPELLINGVKYRGSWSGKYIFDSICTGFLDDVGVCGTPSPDEINTGTGFGFGSVLLIIILICVTTVILLICYRRIVHRSLEESLNEKIQTQTIFSVGQYRIFKEDHVTGRKTIDISKI